MNSGFGRVDKGYLEFCCGLAAYLRPREPLPLFGIQARTIKGDQGSFEGNPVLPQCVIPSSPSRHLPPRCGVQRTLKSCTIPRSSDPVALPLLRGTSAQLDGLFMDTLLPVSALSVLIQDYESLCAHVGHYFRTSSKHHTILGHFIRPTQHPSRQQIRKKIPFNWQKSLEAKKPPSLSWRLRLLLTPPADKDRKISLFPNLTSTLSLGLLFTAWSLFLKVS